VVSGGLCSADHESRGNKLDALGSMSRKLTVITTVSVAIAAGIVSGCAMLVPVDEVLKTYPGPEMPCEQVLLIQDPDGPIIVQSIDGKTQTESGTDYSKASGILLLPGTHVIKVGFLGYRTTKSQKIPVIPAEMKAGHCYRVNPNVNPRDASSNTYIWTPYVADVTSRNDVFRSRVPEHSFEYSFQFSSSKTTCSVESPNSKGWWMLRGRGNPLIRGRQAHRCCGQLTFDKVTSKNIFISSGVSIKVSSCDCLASFDPSAFDEHWFKDLIEAIYTPVGACSELVVQVRTVDEATIEARKFQVIRCQMSYRIMMNPKEIFDEAIVYIAQFGSSDMSRCFVFVLCRSSHSPSDNDAFSDEDMRTFMDVIKSLDCECISSRESPQIGAGN